MAAIVAAGVALSAQQPTFRSGVQLVETSVLVHDRSGRSVNDLKKPDFKVFEDGKEQPIELFTVKDDRVVAVAQPGDAAPGVYSNRGFPPSGGVTVILFDRLNSDFADQKPARDQIVRALAKARPDDRIALYVLESDVIRVLQDFTSDPRPLLEAMARYSGTTSTELARTQEAADTFAKSGLATFDADTEAWLERTMLAVSEFYIRRRAELTTDALVAIARHLAAIPGRKNLVWVSGGFPLMYPTTFDGPQVMTKPVNRAARAINDANVAVYPVDIRGLVGPYGTSPAQANASFEKGKPSQPFATQAKIAAPGLDAMHAIADGTGGRVYENTNAIGTALQRAMDDARVSYVIGYRSPRSEPDNRFHRIEVKVARSGVDVRHRGGYLAAATPVVGDTKARLAALRRVMESPLPATGVEVTAALERGAGNQMSLVMRVDPASITWHERDGVREGALDVVIAQSEPDGTYFIVKETTVNLTADADRYRQINAEGFTMSLGLTLRPKAYRIHVAAADAVSRDAGSLIIPIGK